MTDDRLPPPPPPPPPSAPPPPGYTAPVFYSPPGPVPYGYVPAGYTPARTNGFAVAALVLGIIWAYGIGSVLALIFGYKARREIDRSNGTQTGRGLATAGVVLGWIGVALITLVILVMATVPGGIDSDPSDGRCDQSRYMQDPDC